MAAKDKAAKAGDAAKAVRENPYVQKLIEDPELRENLRNAFESAKKAYGRMNGKGPVKAVTEDKKTQRQLKNAASSLKEAAQQLQGQKKKSHKGRLFMLLIIGAVVALVASEGLRKKVLDALFGKEEEFEYTASTTPDTSASPPPSSSEPVESSST